MVSLYGTLSRTLSVPPSLQIGITADRTSAADYDADMQRAKGLGIDAFALNIGVDPYTDQQLGFAYQSAANNGMKVCAGGEDALHVIEQLLKSRCSSPSISTGTALAAVLLPLGPRLPNMHPSLPSS